MGIARHMDFKQFGRKVEDLYIYNIGSAESFVLDRRGTTPFSRFINEETTLDVGFGIKPLSCRQRLIPSPPQPCV